MAFGHGVGDKMQTAKKNNPETLREVAKEAWRNVSSLDDAVKVLLKKVRKSPRLTEELLYFAVRNYLRSVNSSARTDIIRNLTSVVVPHDDASGLEALAGTQFSNYLDNYRLSTGLPLGDALQENLQHEVIIFLKNASTNAHKARWMREIIKNIGGSKVRDKLTDQDVDKLFRKTVEVV